MIYNEIHMKKGFTLIELLVVIAIIGILAGIIIISLITAQDRAHRISALSTLKSVMPTLHACKEAGGPTSGYAPDSIMVGTDICVGRSEFNQQWPVLSNGWSIANYQTASGTIALGTLEYVGYKAGQRDIICLMSTNTCE